MKPRIVYIVGLGHSGSTLLDMLLGSHSQMRGLGEIVPFLKATDWEKELQSTCSCGEKGYDCPFWSEIPSRIAGTSDWQQAYFQVADFFFEKYGKAEVLVDSSKNSYPYLKKLQADYDLKILYLCRDFRSWTYSRWANGGGLALSKALRWRAENQKLEFQLKRMGLRDYMRVGYEELALYPQFILEKICAYIGLDFEESMLNFNQTRSHIINGNLLRADREKRAAIRYDARWMTSGRIQRTAALLPFFQYNKARVYSNVLGPNLRPKDFHLFNAKRRMELNKKYN